MPDTIPDIELLQEEYWFHEDTLSSLRRAKHSLEDTPFRRRTEEAIALINVEIAIARKVTKQARLELRKARGYA